MATEPKKKSPINKADDYIGLTVLYSMSGIVMLILAIYGGIRYDDISNPYYGYLWKGAVMVGIGRLFSLGRSILRHFEEIRDGE
jgi:hypothetical protein